MSLTSQHSRLISSFASEIPVTRVLNRPAATSRTTVSSLGSGASHCLASHCPQAETATPPSRNTSMKISIPWRAKLVRMMTSVPKENAHSRAEILNCKDQFVIAHSLFFQHCGQ